MKNTTQKNVENVVKKIMKQNKVTRKPKLIANQNSTARKQKVSILHFLIKIVYF